ncbi:MAG: phenylalanine--tRNA ligase subunit beta [Deltaproteobacteria bacterium]|nr:phenylalanine--tRNA ligase subunit beta [Deltaproteobacteria bacterium]
MKLSLNWLRDYVNLDMALDELAHLMTMSGLEVEGIEHLGAQLDGVIVSRILEVKRHPDAEKLFLCRLDTGKGEVQVVCSATNLEEGYHVPLAQPGTKLPDGIMVKESRIRGEISAGMLLAEDEIGLTDDHSGIMLLPQDLEPGMPLSYLDLGDDILEVSLTPNRPDCSSVIGIARELSAITGGSLRLPEIRVHEGETLIEDLISVSVEDVVGCPRYAVGLVQGVEIKSSPFWMRSRLYASGIRSINNVVDVSNYVLMETGQPLHTFDYDRIRQQRIVVKRAKAGEAFTTLDGIDRELDSENLMICDGEGSVALAGIMGGLNSEIYEDSRNILIESAYFDPVSIRRGSKRLGLFTEASYRFERGIDIEGCISALERAEMLILELAGGTVCKGAIDNYPKRFEAPVIELRIKKTNEFLGTDISKDRIASFLTALEMEVTEIDADRLQVRPPSHRVDIFREIDLVEEVARLEGFENIPGTYPFIRPSDEGEMPALALRDQVCDIMAGLGFSEIISYSFISPASVDLLGIREDSSLKKFVKLRNPLTVEQSVMRTSLMPGMLSTVKGNITYGESDLKLFEWGKIFIDEGDELPLEKLSLIAVMTGLFSRKAWHSEERYVDFYDLKGAIEVVFDALGFYETEFKTGDLPPYYEKGSSCNITVSGSSLGYLGKVDPAVIERYEMKAKGVYAFEIDVDALLDKLSGVSIKFKPFTNFPAVFRDISIIVDRNIESAKIMNIIEKEGKGLIEDISLFDLYEGEKIDPNKKTLSYRLCYRSESGTLDGKDINRLHDKIVKSIMQKTGGTLKEG